MLDYEKFIEIAKKKSIITQLQNEIYDVENELIKTFAEEVKNFFLSKDYELVSNQKNSYNMIFLNLRQVDEKNTFYNGSEPRYYIAGNNSLIVRFEWHLIKNSGRSQIYWYPEKQTLDDFYNRRLKKVLILPIKVERKNKLNNIINIQE